jgi:cbb3-type cytochrome oxidase subunit 3
MEEGMTTANMVIATLATVGVVVLVGVFIWVVRMVFFEKKDDTDV